MDLKKEFELLNSRYFDEALIEKSVQLAQKYAEHYHTLQLQQTGVKQSVFYSIVDNGSLLEKFKEKETAEYALEEYKKMGFPDATILETVA